MRAFVRSHGALLAAAVLLTLVRGSQPQAAADDAVAKGWDAVTGLLHGNMMISEEMLTAISKVIERKVAQGCTQDVFQLEQSVANVALLFLVELQKALTDLLNALINIHEDLQEGRCVESQEIPPTGDPSCPGPKEWRCASGGCIPVLNVCDGKRQCADGSDETPGCAVTTPTTPDLPPTPTTPDPPPTPTTPDPPPTPTTPDLPPTPSTPDPPPTPTTPEPPPTPSTPDPPPTPTTPDQPPTPTTPDPPPTSTTPDPEICGPKFYPCRSSSVCIPNTWVCDGEKDCADDSDEQGCFTTTSTPAPPATTTATTPRPGCPRGKVPCRTGGVCIFPSWICDSIPDCPDASDERRCPTTTPPPPTTTTTATTATTATATTTSSTTTAASMATCSVDQFQCVYGQECIPRSWTCDGFYDCPDGSDEYCTSDTQLPSIARLQPLSVETASTPPAESPAGDDLEESPASPKLPGTTAPSIIVTLPSFVFPAYQPQCLASMFQCESNGRCISRTWRCNNRTDCEDGSDERDCSSEWCSEEEFRCLTSKACIPLQRRCDARSDCSDASDEWNCPSSSSVNPTAPSLSPPAAPSPLPMTPSLSTALGNMADQTNQTLPSVATPCVPEMGHFLCANGESCLPSRRVCDDHWDCPDRSDEGPECAVPCPRSACSHDCFATPAGHQCTCPRRFYLVESNNTCEVGPPDGFLLVTLGRRLEAFSLDGTRNFTILPEAEADLRGVSYDPVEEVVYWSRGPGGRVYSRPLRDDAMPHLLFDEESSQVEALAVDWVGRNIYLADSLNHRILVCSLKVRFACYTLLADAISPRAIHLDLKHRLLFWNSGASPEIHQAGMDGTDHHMLVPSRQGLLLSLARPGAMALDPPSRHIYWIDNQLKVVGRLSYDGGLPRFSNFPKEVRNKVLPAQDLTLWGDHIYWVDEKQGQVVACTKKDCREPRVFAAAAAVSAVSRNSKLSIYNSDPQMEVKDPCEHLRCSHLCLLSPKSPFGYTCACPDHLTLQDDDETCSSLSFSASFGADPVHSKLQGLG